MVDRRGLGPRVERREGSSPSIRTSCFSLWSSSQALKCDAYGELSASQGGQGETVS